MLLPMDGKQALLILLILMLIGNVGIGTITPGANLDVVGSIRITDGIKGTGKVLTSDANGLAS